jgi:hypothetical protein
MNRIILTIIVISLLLSACAPKIITEEEKSTIQLEIIELKNQVSTLSVVNQNIVIALSVTPKSTSTPIIPPTATKTPTPAFTPTITTTPTITPTMTATLDPLKKAKGSGMYLVNVDIAPGVWRSDGKNDNCYWKVSSATGGIIRNFFGMAGGTIYIPESGFQVELDGCGTWTFLQNP